MSGHIISLSHPPPPFFVCVCTRVSRTTMRDADPQLVVHDEEQRKRVMAACTILDPGSWGGNERERAPKLGCSGQFTKDNVHQLVDPPGRAPLLEHLRFVCHAEPTSVVHFSKFPRGVVPKNDEIWHKDYLWVHSDINWKPEDGLFVCAEDASNPQMYRCVITVPDGFYLTFWKGTLTREKWLEGLLPRCTFKVDRVGRVDGYGIKDIYLTVTKMSLSYYDAAPLTVRKSVSSSRPS